MAGYRFQAAYRRFWARGKQYLHFWADYYALITGAAADSLPSLTVTATGAHGVAGEFLASLPRLTLNAEGERGVAGTFAATLPRLTLAAAGAHGVAGEFEATFPKLVLDGEGFAFEEGTVAGSFEAALPALSLAGEATVPRRRRGGGRAHEDTPIYTRLRKKKVVGRFKAILPALWPYGAGLATAVAKKVGDQPVSSPQTAETPILGPFPALRTVTNVEPSLGASIPALPPARERARVRAREGAVVVSIPRIGLAATGDYQKFSDEDLDSILEALDLAA